MIGANQARRVAHCKGCEFLSMSTLSCDYLLITKKRRPCPAGEGCTVKSATGVGGKGKLDRDKRIPELYNAGKNDAEIARETGYHIGSIRNWRKRHHCLPNAKRGKPKKKEEQDADGK